MLTTIAVFLALAQAATLPAGEPDAPVLTPAERAAFAQQAGSTTSVTYKDISPKELAKQCVNLPCRHGVAVHLLKADGTHFDQNLELLPPMIQGGVVVLYPSDIARLLPVFKDGQFVEWKPAPARVDETMQVITIEFRQLQGKPDMMAVISKNSGPAIKLSLGMFVLDGPDHPLKTSSCGLVAGKFSDYESWPHPIYSLLIGPPHRLSADSQVTCD